MTGEKPNTKFISIAGIGEVSITKNRLSRRLRISINRNKIVKVSIPFRISFSEGERFLFEKIDWVKKSIEKFDKYVQKPILIDEQTEFHTRTRVLKLSKDDVDNFQINISGSGIQITYPNKVDLKSPAIQENLKYLIIEAMRLESKEYFPGRVAELARLHGFKYSTVKIRN
jgi:predicted metal-dependent hydrolase